MSTESSEPDRTSAFIPLIMESQRALKNYLYSLHPHADDLDDLFQETSLKLWQVFGEYDMSRPFLPWALRIAYFQVLRFRKERVRDRLVFPDNLVELLAGEAPPPGQADLVRSCLNDCLETLSPRAREVLLSRYSLDSSISELARQTRRSAHVLYRLLEKSRGQVVNCLRRKLASEGFVPAASANP